MRTGRIREKGKNKSTWGYMEAWKSKQAAGCAALGILTIAICLLLCKEGKIFGADGDWMSQHSVIADYFRQQFYETGQLFPEFAANIGGGQNIYNFSYYGLYSPVILISYLFPFVKMGNYLMAASVLELMFSAMLFYCWMLRRRFSQIVSFGTAMMLLLSGPMLFHSHSQVMFVNYMPFLCMALWGVDRYFSKNKAGVFAVSVFLMIMTSFYFSIGGMLVLVLYGLHRYFQTKDAQGCRVTVWGFFTDGMRFAVPMVSAVMMSGILLVPTALALSGRSGVIEKTSLSELFYPDVSVLRFVYTPYGIGLTTLVITVLITGLTDRKFYERVLSYGSVIVLVIPVFSWMLNGGLYIRDKVLIPFLPLLCYMTACYLEKLRKRELTFWQGFLPYLVTLGILYVGRNQGTYAKYWKLVMLDGIIMAVCFLIFYFLASRWEKNILCLIAPTVIFLLIFAEAYHTSADGMADKEFYDKVTDGKIGAAIEKILEEDEGFYRIEQMGTVTENGANMNRIWNMRQYVSSIYSSSYNEFYQKFRQSVFETEESLRNIMMQPSSRNPLFQRFMGVKYLVMYGDQDKASENTQENGGTDPEEKIPGYELYETVGNIRIYRNENVSPIAYGTDRIMSGEDYEKLEFPYNQLALMSYAVVENENENAPEETTGDHKITDREKLFQEDTRVVSEAVCSVVPAEMEIPDWEEDGDFVKQTDGGYHVQLKEKETVDVPISADTEEKMSLLFLQFQVKNNKPSKDVSIWLEKEKNTLSASSHIYYNENTTFTYAVALEEGQKAVEVAFGKGDYEITAMKCYLGRTDRKAMEEECRKLYQEEFHQNREETKGNRITGTIDAKNDGFFITTIPYEDSFTVKVDGQIVEGEKVNTAFLGFPIKKGSHQIEIIYHAPGVAAGKVMSLIGVILLLCCFLSERKRIRSNMLFIWNPEDSKF